MVLTQANWQRFNFIPYILEHILTISPIIFETLIHLQNANNLSLVNTQLLSI